MACPVGAEKEEECLGLVVEGKEGSTGSLLTLVAVFCVTMSLYEK
jgi:hypothetical protein